MKQNFPLRCFLALAGSSLLTISHLHATSATWNGTSNTSWATTTNWSSNPAIVPGVGDTATFNNAGNGNTTITVGTISLTQVSFNTANAAAYTLGSGTITFADGTTTAVSRTATVTNNQTINANITLGTAITSNTTFTNASTTGLLTLGGNITGGTGGTAAAKTLTFTGAGNITVLGNISAGGATNLLLDKRSGAGTLTLSGANAFAGGVNIGGSGAGTSGTVRLASGGSITSSAGVRLLLGFNAGQSGTFTMDTGAGTATFGGNRGGAANYIGVDGGTGTVNANGGTLNFTGMANGSGHLLIGANSGTSSGTITVAGGTVNVGTRVQMGSAFGGEGAAGWATTGDGTATLTISSGTMNIGTAAAGDTDSDKGFLYLKGQTSGTGTATVNLDGGTLSLVRFAIGAGGTSRVVNFNGGTVQARASRTDFLGTGATLNVKDNGAVIDTNTFNITIAGSLVNSGTGGLTKLNTGILTLTGTNTYTGNTTISAGALEIGGAGQLNSGAYSGNIANAGTLNFNSTANQTLSGNLSGAGALTKNASGVLTLSGTNSLYTGNTTITAGTLAFSGGNNRLSTTGNITIGASGTLDLGGNTQTTTGLVTFTSGATLKGGTLTSNNAALGNNNVFTGTINLGAGGAFVTNQRLLVALGGTSSLTIGTGSTGSITFGGDGSSAMNYVGVDGGNGTLNVNGGTVNFNNASAPGTGNGYLNVGSNNNSSAGSIVVNGGNVNVGTWLKLGGNFATNVGTNATSSLAITTGTVTVGGGSDATSNGVLFMNGGAGDMTANTGTSTLTLNSSGALNVKQIQAGNQGTKTINFDGGTLRAGATSTSFLDAATGLTLNVKNGGAAIDTQAFNVTVGAALVANGSGGLTKSGAGALTLTNTNTYTGATTVSNGKLIVDGSISTSALTTVQSGATLGGKGSVGAATIQAGGINSAAATLGTAADVQKFTGNLTYQDASIFAWEIAKTNASSQTRGIDYDAANVTGTLAGLDGVDVGSTTDAIFRIVIGDNNFSDTFWDTTRNWSNIFTAADGTTAKASWASIFGGGFQYQKTDGTTLTAPTAEGSFSLSSNTLTWTAVPEPSSALAGMLLAAGLLRRRRN